MRHGHRFASLATRIRDYWPPILVAVGAIGLSLLNMKRGNSALAVPLHPDRWMIVLLAGIVIFLGECVGIHRQKRLSALEQDFEESELALSRALAAVEKLARIELVSIARELNYYSDERLSLFSFAGDHFELVARYSDHPEHNDAARRSYGVHGGCLGKAWEHDRAALIVSVARDQDGDQWEREHATSGLPLPVVKELRMPVRTVIACRVNDPRDAEPPLGVFVMESVRANDAQLVPGAQGAVLDPDVAANQITTRMPRLAAILSIVSEIDEARTGSHAIT